MLQHQPTNIQQQHDLQDINTDPYNEQILVPPNDDQQQQSDLPVPQHKTLIPTTNLPSDKENRSLTLNHNEDNDWDLRQLEAYQDIVA